MKTSALVSFLLVCTVAANPLLDDVIQMTEDMKDMVEDVVEDMKHVIKEAEVYILDDHGKPVLLNLKDDYPETLQATQEDLGNRVFFYLHTRNTRRSGGQMLSVNDVNALNRSDFNPNRPTKFVTHGWINSKIAPACTLVRDAFLKHGDYNVIVVDWSSISFRPYLWASRRVVMVGEYVSKMIDFLVHQGMNPKQVTIVGHSLGGHVAGLSAHHAKNKVKYVIALDPALPAFSSSGPGSRVSKGDADYVQVIHTSGGVLGYESAIGDSDFYPNGGTLQAGCALDIGGSCSHPRAYKYFAESLNSSKGFIAQKCSSYEVFKLGGCRSQPTAIMGGIEPHTKVRGSYFLNTNRHSPFAQG